MRPFIQLIDSCTQGPWVLGGGIYTVREQDVTGWRGFVCRTRISGGQSRNESEDNANAEFIARCNPATMVHVWCVLNAAKAALADHTGPHGAAIMSQINTAIDELNCAALRPVTGTEEKS